MLYEVKIVFDALVGGRILRLKGLFTVSATDEAEAVKIVAAKSRGRVIHSDARSLGSSVLHSANEFAPELKYSSGVNGRRFEKIIEGPVAEVEAAAHAYFVRLNEMSGPVINIEKFWDGTARAVVKSFSVD